jgi:glycosyltransferase involved in cell wall biosynthesis
VNFRPIVSAILPTYNRGRLLRDAVESVVRQTFVNWELVIVDDGSTDGSTSFVSELADRRIRVTNIAHSGSPARARNAGVDVASGEWITFLDSDDVWLPQKLELQITALREQSACGWSCTGFGFIDEVGAPTHQRAGRPYQPVSGWILDELLGGVAGLTVALQTVAVRRSLLAEVGEFDDALVPREDFDLILRLARRSQILALRDPLTLIREHTGRTTARMSTAYLFEQGARMFQKAAGVETDRRRRAWCRRQCAVHRVAKARTLSRDGAHREALTTIAQAMKDDPAYPTVWRAGLGCVIRAGRHVSRTAP